MDYLKYTFTFSVENIWNIARLRSANISNHITVNGASQESKLALTDSERDLWNVSIRYPANRVYDYLMSAGKIKTGTYTYDTANTAGLHQITYVLYLHPDWDTNLARSLNDHIERAIVAGGLAEWFKSCMSADAYNLAQQEYDDALRSCAININKRRFKTQRPHTTF